MRVALVLPFIFGPLLGGCQEQASGPAVAPPIPTVSANGKVFALDKIGSAALNVSSPAKVKQSDLYVTISGVPSDASSAGTTGPAFLKISGDLEQSVSGKVVKVTITARSTTAKQLMAAYSTAEVGNSGWKSFNLTPEWRSYTFEWSVPPMKNANGDYIGLKSDGAIDVGAIAVDVEG